MQINSVRMKFIDYPPPTQLEKSQFYIHLQIPSKFVICEYAFFFGFSFELLVTYNRFINSKLNKILNMCSFHIYMRIVFYPLEIMP